MNENKETRKHPRWKDLNSFIITTSDEKIDKQIAHGSGSVRVHHQATKIKQWFNDAFNLMIDLMNSKSQ